MQSNHGKYLFSTYKGELLILEASMLFLLIRKKRKLCLDNNDQPSSFRFAHLTEFEGVRPIGVAPETSVLYKSIDSCFKRPDLSVFATSSPMVCSHFNCCFQVCITESFSVKGDSVPVWIQVVWEIFGAVNHVPIMQFAVPIQKGEIFFNIIHLLVIEAQKRLIS